MSPAIDLSERTYAKLRAMGGSLFTEAEVVDRLVEEHERCMENTSASGLSSVRSDVSPATGGVSGVVNVRTREPRQRGATVEILGQRLVASSVGDLYEQAIRLLVDGGHMERLRTYVPFPSSPRRYLIAKAPTHQRGNRFVVPIDYAGLYMEAHKDYRTALKDLGRFLGKVGIGLTYLG